MKKLNQGIVACERCPRLLKHCQTIAKEKRRAYQDWDYWGKPVPNFGDARAKFLIVGLAPAAHGANRTGRMFTGDRSGDWLYRALAKAGFANQAAATDLKDGLKLKNCLITAVCHCAPPDNKPTTDEIENCRPWLEATLDANKYRVYLALGQLGWRAALRAFREQELFDGKLPKFGHGVSFQLKNGAWLIGSYHPSQQNTFTKRLTEPMFDAIFKEVRVKLGSGTGSFSQ